MRRNTIATLALLALSLLAARADAGVIYHLRWGGGWVNIEIQAPDLLTGQAEYRLSDPGVSFSIESDTPPPEIDPFWSGVIFLIFPTETFVGIFLRENSAPAPAFLITPELDDAFAFPRTPSELGTFDGIGEVTGEHFPDFPETRSMTAQLTVAQVIPEPSGLVLLGTGAVGLLGCVAWRRRPRPL